MTQFAYIFDKTYASALTKLVDFIDEKNLWNDYFECVGMGLNPTFADGLFANTNTAGIDLNELTESQQENLISDLKFMSGFDNKETRELNFKEYYCSSRLFDHLPSSHDRSMCQTAYNVIIQADGWDYLKNFNPDPEEGFAWTSDLKINSLKNRIAEVDTSHSGISLAYTMRILRDMAFTGMV